MKKIKNIRVVGETLRKIKGKIAALVTATTMFVVSPSVSAEGNKVTVEELVDAMITGNRISAEMTEEEVSRLEIEAEQAIKADGASLLPVEIREIYNNLANLTGEEKEKQVTILAGLCDAVLKSGEANIMPYPHAIQFETVCEELVKNFNDNEDESQFGETDLILNVKDILNQAKTNREIKKSTYINSAKADLGFYDHCFLGEQDQNMPTGEKENQLIILSSLGFISGMVAAPTGVLIGIASEKRKEKKRARQYTKTNR